MSIYLKKGEGYDPRATHDVIKARLTPIEFMGYLKGCAFTWNDTAAGGGNTQNDTTPFERALFFQNELVLHEEDVGWSKLFPEPPAAFFWTSEGDFFEGASAEQEALLCCPIGEVCAVHSNLPPFFRFVVRYVIDDNDHDHQLFSLKENAEKFAASLRPKAASRAEARKFRRALLAAARKKVVKPGRKRPASKRKAAARKR